MRVARQYGHHVALFGHAQPWLPDISFSMDVARFDKVVFLFESEIYRVPRVNEAALLGAVPRRDRMVLDMDGMYNPALVLDGYDRNHESEEAARAWATHFDALSDRVMKPRLAGAEPGGVGRSLTFYGYDPALETDPAEAPEKIFDVVYVGHNWWR